MNTRNASSWRNIITTIALHFVKIIPRPVPTIGSAFINTVALPRKTKNHNHICKI